MLQIRAAPAELDNLAQVSPRIGRVWAIFIIQYTSPFNYLLLIYHEITNPANDSSASSQRPLASQTGPHHRHIHPKRCQRLASQQPQDAETRCPQIQLLLHCCFICQIHPNVWRTGRAHLRLQQYCLPRQSAPQTQRSALPRLDIDYSGGDTDLNINTTWTKNADYILKYGMEQNRKGNVFPIWGTCLGMQLLAYLTSGYDGAAIAPVNG